MCIIHTKCIVCVDKLHAQEEVMVDGISIASTPPLKELPKIGGSDNDK